MKRPDAASVYLAMRALMTLANAIMFTTYALYYVQALGLTPLQLVLVGTAVEATVVLFEIPTGVVADSYSRRLSVIIGTAVLGGAYLLQGAVPWLGGLLPFFAGIVLAEIIRGIGWTFISGAREAWIADEIGTEQLGALLLRAGKLDRAMKIVGIGLSVGLATISLNLPFLTGGLLHALLALFLWLVMPENHFTPAPREDRSTWQSMAHTFQEGVASVRGRPVLIALLALAVIGGAASEGLDRLWEAHMLLTLSLESIGILPIAAWFGLFRLGGSLAGMATAHWAERRLDLERPGQVSRVLLIAAGLRTGLLLGFALSPSLLWAVVAILLIQAVNAVYEPVHDTWLNQHIDSRVRATVLSFMGQADAVGQSGGGPVVGWVGTRFSLRAALALASAFLAPGLGVYGWIVKRENA